MHEDLGVGDHARDAFALGVDEDGGDGEGEAAVAELGVDALNGVADGAGEAVTVEAAVAGGAAIEGAGEDGDGVVAAIAVAGVLDALGAEEDVDAGAIEGRPEGVGVKGLTPLTVGLLVAVAAVGGVGEVCGGEEVVGFGDGVAGERDAVGREEETVGLADTVRVGLVGCVRWDCWRRVVGGLGGLRGLGGADGGPEKQAGSCEG
jgi:hypothetical protein